MSQSASPRQRTVLVVAFALVVVAVVGVALWKLTGSDDTAKPLATGSDRTTTATTTTPPTTTTPTKTKKPKTTTSCDGPTTQFNIEGTEQDSLLPDCGTAPVTVQQQKKTGLTLACGGRYPVILYKTTTADYKTSICGKDASGVDFHFVTQPTGGTIVDVKGDYDGELDSYLARHDGVKYVVQAYDGTLFVTKDGKTTTQKSSDWISLDNESDYD